VINISTLLSVNSVEVTVGGLKHVGTTLALPAGAFQVTPLKSGQFGALHTAANRFSANNVPTRGWEWNMFVSIDGGTTGTKYGFGGGSPAIDGTYQATADLAFAAAPAPFVLNYASPTSVTFYWVDDNFADNQGGISFSVEAVPEPATLVLGAAGLVAAIRRRRARVA